MLHTLFLWPHVRLEPQQAHYLKYNCISKTQSYIKNIYIYFVCLFVSPLILFGAYHPHESLSASWSHVKMFNTVYLCYIPIVLPETVLIFLLCAQRYNCFFFSCFGTPLSSCFPTFLGFVLLVFFVRSTLNTVHCWWNKTSKRCCLKLHTVDLRSFLSPLVASLCAEWDAVCVWKVVRKLRLRPQSPLARYRCDRPTDKRFETSVLCSVTVTLL